MKFELTTLPSYSDEDILKEIRRVAETVNTTLSRKYFDSISRVHSSTVSNRFGSWRNALDRAGVSEKAAIPPKRLSKELVIEAIKEIAKTADRKGVTVSDVAGFLKVDKTSFSGRFGTWKSLLAEVGLEPSQSGKRYTEKECLENILLLWTHYGRQPRFGDLKQPPSMVGPKAYIGRWGGWRKSLAAFIDFVNQVEGSGEIKEKEISPIANSSFVPNKTPRSINATLRLRVLFRDHYRCVICGRSPAKQLDVELHIDHIHPWSLGGQTVIENLRSLCKECNLGKGASTDFTVC